MIWAIAQAKIEAIEKGAILALVDSSVVVGKRNTNHNQHFRIHAHVAHVDEWAARGPPDTYGLTDHIIVVGLYVGNSPS